LENSAFAERVPVGADELDTVGLADFLDVFSTDHPKA